jgi:hypothetical protein
MIPFLKIWVVVFYTVRFWIDFHDDNYLMRARYHASYFWSPNVADYCEEPFFFRSSWDGEGVKKISWKFSWVENFLVGFEFSSHEIFRFNSVHSIHSFHPRWSYFLKRASRKTLLSVSHFFPTQSSWCEETPPRKYIHRDNVTTFLNIIWHLFKSFPCIFFSLRIVLLDHEKKKQL